MTDEAIQPTEPEHRLSDEESWEAELRAERLDAAPVPVERGRPADLHWGVVTKGLQIKVADGRQTRTLLDGVDLDCPPGTMTAITGPSGCGKTTLLTCLAGVAEFQGGDAWVAGQHRKPKTRARPNQLRDIGVVFQDYRLIKSLNVRDNVAIALNIDGWSWSSSRPPAVDLLEQFGLGPHLKKRPSALSGGEQQRVALARAAIGRPKVLLADEPSAHLDRDSASLLASYLLGLAQWGACVVLSTHDPRLLVSCHQQVELG